MGKPGTYHVQMVLVSYYENAKSIVSRRWHHGDATETETLTFV